MKQGSQFQDQFDAIQKKAESVVSSEKLSKLAEQTTGGAKKIADFITKTVSNLDKKQLTILMPAIVIALSMLVPKEKEEEKDDEKEDDKPIAPQSKPEDVLGKIERAEESRETLHKEGYWKLEHPKYGRVHVWHPEYRGDPPKETVLCLHGYNQTADQFWRNNKLAEQFRKSGKKALFIVPQSPRNNKENMEQWRSKTRDLEGMLQFVSEKTGNNTRDNKITLMGHSGAYMTMASWLKNGSIKEVVLLDATYGLKDFFIKWAKKKGNRLVVAISKDRGVTRRDAQKIAKVFPGCKIYKGVPNPSRETRDSEIIYIQTRFSHNGIVRGDAGVISGILSLSNPEVRLRSQDFLACKDKKDCERLLKTSGRYFYDERTGNYLNKRIFRKERLLDESMVTKKWWNQESITLKRSVYEMLKEADRRMFEKTGKHIMLTSSFRNWSYQFNIYKKHKSRDKDFKVGKPGNSFHGTGQAIDVVNWKQAEPYLLAVGFHGGSKGYKGDPVHFSVGEFKSIDRALIAKYSKRASKSMA